MAEGETPSYEPDFGLPYHDVIHEDNWPEYAARGFRVVDRNLESIGEVGLARARYGMEHVYTGDAWDEAEGRPLRHKPGIGVYVDPDGLAIRAAKDEAERQRHHKPEADPA